MNSPVLVACHRVAEKAQYLAMDLGFEWKGYRPVTEKCAKFREACDGIATNRGLPQVTIAFVGPKNAGKTTVLSLLVASEERRALLPVGEDAGHSTVRPIWLGPEPPSDWQRDLEDYVPCAEGELESLGFRFTLLDVPGLDERRPDHQIAAMRALDEAQIKVLVIDRSQLVVARWKHYLAPTDGASIVPVITYAPKPDDPFNALGNDELARFENELKAHLPTSVIAPAIIVSKFTDRNTDESAVLSATRRALRERLVAVAAGQSVQILAERRLAAKLPVFKKDIAFLATQYLPATTRVLGPIQEELRALPEEVVHDLLGSERKLMADIHASLRAMLRDRTPIFLFPWRLALSIANLVHGATDRLPLALLGSPLSILTTASTTAKNLWNRVQFNEDIQSGLRRGVEARLKDKLSSRLTDLERNLAADLNSGASAKIHTKENASVRLIGLETLQSKSTEFFNEVIESNAPSRSMAWVLGILGFAMFWSILGQPLWGLYLDFFHAGQEVLARRASSIQSFPSDTFSMLATSTLLALLPMTLLLLLAVTWFVRESQTKRCIAQLRQRHAAQIKEMTANGTLFAELTEPQLDSCRQLLAFDASGAP